MPLDVVTPEIRRYLLGDLDAAGAAALEDRYVADPALLDNVRAAEDALIAAFLEDRLGPADRDRFEAHYLASPVHRDRVAIARALRQRAAGPPAVVGRRRRVLRLDGHGRGAGACVAVDRLARRVAAAAAGGRRRRRRASQPQAPESAPASLRLRRSCRPRAGPVARSGRSSP